MSGAGSQLSGCVCAGTEAAAGDILEVRKTLGKWVAETSESLMVRKKRLS